MQSIIKELLSWLASSDLAWGGFCRLESEQVEAGVEVKLIQMLSDSADDCYGDCSEAGTPLVKQKVASTS